MMSRIRTLYGHYIALCCSCIFLLTEEEEGEADALQLDARKIQLLMADWQASGISVVQHGYCNVLLVSLIPCAASIRVRSTEYVCSYVRMGVYM